MKKILIITFSSILVIIISLIGIHFYQDYRVKHAYKYVKLNREEIEVFETIKLKDIIEEINGTLEKNEKIDTTKKGTKKITFYYTTDKNIKVPYTIKIKIVDNTPPLITMTKEKTITIDSTEKELLNSFFCGDNYDDNPKCFLEGDYDLKKTGTYQVKLIGVDSSNNRSESSLKLRVIEKSNSKSNSNSNSSTNYSYTSFDEIKKKYKTKNTKIGIDISHWQGNIDFQKVKDAGVEFAYIRVGRGNGVGKEYVEDEKFKRNIEGFQKVKIPVGVYFYSNANSISDAKKEAEWLMKKIKKYKVEKELVFDWENWPYYYEYNLSFYHLTEVAKTFISTVEKKGYKGMLYSSKYYLENIWFPIKSRVWLAHYTEKTNYKGNYNVWQICSDGKVKGIKDSLVDINILYE